MRYLVACALCLYAGGYDAAAHTASGVTVLLHFEGEKSSRAVEAIRTELTRLMKPAGVELEYRLGSELGPENVPTDIIVVKLKGKCRRDMFVPLPDERGPFAVTHVSNGEILPFAEVSCERVQASIRAVSGQLVGNISDDILGRALGRVVAHEVYHILAKTPHHGTHGVARTGLSSSDLVAENLVFSEDEIEKMHRRGKH